MPSDPLRKDLEEGFASISRQEELLAASAAEGLAKRYPFFRAYSDMSFALFRSFRGPAAKELMIGKTKKITMKTTIK